MELLTPDIGLVVWSTISFLLLLVLLKKFAWKPIVESIDERNNSIKDSLAQAEKARAEMAQLVAHNEEVLKEAKEERNNILREANKVKEQIIADAKTRAQAETTKMMDDVREEVAIQKQAVMTEMKNAAAALAVEIAEKVISKDLNEGGKHQDYINELAANATLK